MIEELIKSLIGHPILISIIGPFLFGGETILILAILAGQNLIPLWMVVLFCIFGMFLADTMWFLIGKIKALSKLKKIKWIHKGYKRAKKEIEEAPNELFLLILIKFAYGIGIPILLYLGRKGMSLKKFILNNILIIASWSLVITILGWSIGKTSAIAMDKFENIYASILLIVTGFILVNILFKEIRSKVIIKLEKIKNGNI